MQISHYLQNICSFKNVYLRLWKHATHFSHTCINEEQLSDILILFQVHFLNNFQDSARREDSVKSGMLRSREAESVVQDQRACGNSIPMNPCWLLTDIFEAAQWAGTAGDEAAELDAGLHRSWAL